jgi:predicted dehydrogenase
MRIAVLGLGFMGSTHLKAWRQIPGAEVAAVCSNDKRRLSEVDNGAGR